MANRFVAGSDEATLLEEKLTEDEAAAEGFRLLTRDEIELLIAYCEAPSLFWDDQPAQARAPEPFGMIA
jgi:hypothetical protein